MKKINKWSRLLNLILIAFFLLGAFMNLFGPASIAEDFVKWGYPVWFRYVPGSMELVTAALLSVLHLRKIGILLGSLVMISALLTLIVNGEWLHAAMPASILMLLYLLFKLQTAKW